jgi:ferredoxin
MSMACIDCGKCNKACPSHLPVDKLVQIRSVECTGCMECVAVCPAENALQMALPPWPQSVVDRALPQAAQLRWQRRALKPQMVAAVLAVVFFGLIGAARIPGIGRPMFRARFIWSWFPMRTDTTTERSEGMDPAVAQASESPGRTGNLRSIP